MKNEIQVLKKLFSFIGSSPTAYQASETIESRLAREGFKKLNETEPWILEKNTGYYAARNGSSVIAFRTGNRLPWESGFSIAGAHTDSPGLKLKFDGGSEKGGLFKNSTEVYGGPIISSWFDRDLSVAGTVMLESNNRFERKNCFFKEPLAVIPNLAIHLNRDVNKGFEYNRQNHLQAILSSSISDKIAEMFGVEKGRIKGGDLFLYDPCPGTILSGSIFTAPRIDNLAMCHAILNPFCAVKSSESTNVAVFYDNEEVGSTTYQGADSSFLSGVLERVVAALGGAKDYYYRAKALSFMISADGAHGVHPNFSDKHDPDYAPVLNKGPVVKMNAGFKYATTSESALVFESLCESAGVPFQKFINRSDMPSGSTIGAISSAILGIRTVDVGNPMLAMHSIRETAGVDDHYAMIKVLKEFYKKESLWEDL